MVKDICCTAMLDLTLMLVILAMLIRAWSLLKECAPKFMVCGIIIISYQGY